MAEFKVLRRHDGDKEYHAGDTRTAEVADVAHLLKLGVLEQVSEKAAVPVANKAAKPVLIKPELPAANKAAPAIKNKAAE